MRRLIKKIVGALTPTKRTYSKPKSIHISSSGKLT